jgi:hypothetical protein
LTFFFQKTYNTWLHERYMDFPLTHLELDPDLWLEAKSTDGPNRNWVYDILNTTIENMQGRGRSVLTVGSQPRSSHQFSIVQAIVREQIESQTTQLNEETVGLRIKWMSSSSCWQPSLVHVVNLVAILVLAKICLCLLLRLLFIK